MTRDELEDIGRRLQQRMPWFLDNHKCECTCHDRGQGYTLWLSCCQHYDDDARFVVPPPATNALFRKESFWSDVWNIVFSRSIYREPKERTLSDARAEIESARSRRKDR